MNNSILCLLVLSVVGIAVAIQGEDVIFDWSKLGRNVYTHPDPKVGEKLAAWNPEVDPRNPEEFGSYFEGDIMVDGPFGKNVILNLANRWPSATIPIVVNETFFTPTQVNFIKTQFTYLHQRTCLRFVILAAWHTNWVEVTGDSTGCWSYVGNIQRGRQLLNLTPPGCINYRGTIIHELLHATGFFHEHTRYDRDQYVQVNLQNVQVGQEHNFDILGTSVATTYGVGYNYSSVMHYSATSFSSNGQPTLTPLQSAPNMGQRDYIADSDTSKVWTMYSCTGTTLPPPVSSRMSEEELYGNVPDLPNGDVLADVAYYRRSLKK